VVRRGTLRVVAGPGVEVALADDPAEGETVLAVSGNGDGGDVSALEDRVEALEALTPIAPNLTAATAYTFVADDARRLTGFTAATSVAATVPPNSSVAYALGTRLRMAALGAGQVTLAGGVGVTLRTSASLLSRAQYSDVTAEKIDTNEWLVTGDRVL
jgi:hypothetical protein